jgi:archaellum component FlaC
MALIAWIRSKLLLAATTNGNSDIQALRKEIEKIKKENMDLNEKVIVFPHKNSEQIQVKFIDNNIEEEIIKNIRGVKMLLVTWNI